MCPVPRIFAGNWTRKIANQRRCLGDRRDREQLDYRNSLRNCIKLYQILNWFLLSRGAIAAAGAAIGNVESATPNNLRWDSGANRVEAVGRPESPGDGAVDVVGVKQHVGEVAGGVVGVDGEVAIARQFHGEGDGGVGLGGWQGGEGVIAQIVDPQHAVFAPNAIVGQLGDRSPLKPRPKAFWETGGARQAHPHTILIRG